MTHDPKDYQTLALAGLAQAAALVHAIANGRPVDTAARQACLGAITTHRADSLGEVFPASGDVRLGMQTLSRALAGEAITPEIARYALKIVDLAKRLRTNQAVSARLGQLLDELGGLEPGPGELAHVYQETISHLGKQVQVTGDPGLLRQDSVANSIRAQLLAGVRFAWLWQQLGGRRWHLILRRRSLLVALQSLMSRD